MTTEYSAQSSLFFIEADPKLAMVSGINKYLVEDKENIEPA